MKSYLSLLLFGLVTPFFTCAQVHVLKNTSITIDAGTTLKIIGLNNSVTIDSSSFVNNGIVVLGDSTILVETPNYPIYGNGYETITTDFSGALSFFNIGGLGAEISTDSILGITTLNRGHIAYNNGVNQSILRWFEFIPSNNNQLQTQFTFYYDDTELNSLPESNLKLHLSTDAGLTWRYISTTNNNSTNTLTTNVIDSLYLFTVFDATTSISEITNPNSFEVYPNPNNGYFTISSSAIGIKRIEILNIKGQLLFVDDIVLIPEEGVQIDATSIPSGIYFVKLVGDNINMVKPIMIQ